MQPVVQILLFTWALFCCVELVYQELFEFIIDTSCNKYMECMYLTEMCIVPAYHLHRYHSLFPTWVGSAYGISNPAESG